MPCCIGCGPLQQAIMQHVYTAAVATTASMVSRFPRCSLQRGAQVLACVLRAGHRRCHDRCGQGVPVNRPTRIRSAALNPSSTLAQTGTFPLGALRGMTPAVSIRTFVPPLPLPLPRERRTLAAMRNAFVCYSKRPLGVARRNPQRPRSRSGVEVQSRDWSGVGREHSYCFSVGSFLGGDETRESSSMPTCAA